MPAASNVPWDVAMSRPSPLSAPVYSPTTAPMSAKPKAECSDARIQEVALGTTIVVSTPNRLAPRMRALLTRLRSTSRAPWKALKNTAKKTSTTAVATFEDRPRPNQITNSDARTMRGTALAALMNGAATSARKRARPSRMPSTTPAIAPSTNPPTASSSVTAIWAQIEPAEVPVVNQPTKRKRVSLAQTLVNEPEIMLMDEPFSALDVQTRGLMQDELLRLWAGTGAAVVFVTHDLEEAIALADRVVVMTASPATVKATFPVPLQRPRDVDEIRLTTEFLDTYREVWECLRDEVARSRSQSLEEARRAA